MSDKSRTLIKTRLPQPGEYLLFEKRDGRVLEVYYNPRKKLVIHSPCYRSISDFVACRELSEKVKVK